MSPFYQGYPTLIPLHVYFLLSPHVLLLIMRGLMKKGPLAFSGKAFVLILHRRIAKNSYFGDLLK